MKKIIILFCIYTLVIYNGLAQQKTVLNTGLSKAIVAVADSMRLHYPYNYKFYAGFGDIIFSVGNKYIGFDFPPKLPNERTAREVFNILDSLARTKIYTNKIVANGIAYQIVEYYSQRRDTVCYTCDNTIMEAWQEKLVLDLVRMDMDYCMRIMMDGHMVISYLPRHLYTPEIINKIKGLYANPFLSTQEAEILAQREGAIYHLADTAGFASLDRVFYDLPLVKRNFTQYIRTDILRASRKNMTLKQYYDSLNLVNNEYAIKAFTGIEFMGIQSLIHQFSDKKAVKLAPFIDSLYHSSLSKKWKYINFELILARIGYKDYPEEQMEKYSQILDTTINYIKQNSLSQDKINEAGKIISYSFNKLTYIGTQECFYRAAPLLTLNQMYYGHNVEYRIGAQYFITFDTYYVKNFPWDKKKYEEVKEGEPPHGVDWWYIDNMMPKDFLEKMYQWMIANRGKYEIVQEK